MTLTPFFVLGFSHHNLEVSIRSLLALDENKQNQLMATAKNRGISSLMILNTCNRTEIYGMGNVDVCEQIYAEVCPEFDYYKGFSFKKKDSDAILHVLNVAGGLDSKIIGDMEILSQFKKAYHFSKEKGMCNGKMEKIINISIASARKIRANTNITSGTVSPSYAVVKKIKDHFKNKKIKILLVGAGKFGERIAKNIKQYLPQADLTITNRSCHKSIHLSTSLNFAYLDFIDFKNHLSKFDIIITSIHSENGFLLNENDINTLNKKHWFVDMSVPLAIDPQIAEHNPLINYFNLDQISEEISNVKDSRIKEIPEAEKIILQHKNEIVDWLTFSEMSGYIKSWKREFTKIANDCQYATCCQMADKSIVIEQKMKKFVSYLKSVDKTELLQKDTNLIKEFVFDNASSSNCILTRKDHRVDGLKCKLCQIS